jgi:polysaccharide deacetylase 2 family uncharacterized protein YibQ
LTDLIRRFLKSYGRDLAIAGVGAALGLAVVIVEIVRGPDPVPPPSKISDAQPRQQTVRREPAEVAGPSAPEAEPLPAETRKEETARPDVVPAWQRLAAAYPPVSNRPMIAVIIDDMGIDRKRSARAIGLGGPLTMSFLTYAKELKEQSAAAREAGHEVMVHVPMEPEGTIAEPGPNVIRTDQDTAEIRKRLDWALGRVEGFVGINNHMGSRFTADEEAMTLVLTELKRRGLLFVDSRTTRKTVARRLSRKLAVPFAERDVFIDDDPRPQAILRQLDEVVQTARERKYAVAIGHPREATLAALHKWLPTLRLRGIALVPVSAVVKYRMKLEG